MAEEEKKEPNKGGLKASFVQLCADIKNTLRRDRLEIKNHILIGVEVDDTGQPTSIISSIQIGGYTGLGMIEALRIMLEKAEADASEGFINIIHQNDRNQNESDFAGIPKHIIDKIPPELIKQAGKKAVEEIQAEIQQVGGDEDKEVADVLEEFKEELGDALMSKDEKKLKEVEDKIHARLRDIKGPDFTAKFAFGISGPDNSPPPGPGPMFPQDPEFPPEDYNSGFDLKKIKKYF